MTQESIQDLKETAEAQLTSDYAYYFSTQNAKDILALIEEHEARDAKCEHRFVLESTHYDRESNGYMSDWRRLNIYFCEKCLGKKQVLKKEWAREMPLWWKH